MASTSINVELDEYISILTPAQKKSLLAFLKSFVIPKTASGRVSIEQYNKEIDEAMTEAATGKFITQEELEKQSASL
ncbi:MAG TPA: hypothetical protein VF974_03340 [Patescibacteria group bacterium]